MKQQDVVIFILAFLVIYLMTLLTFQPGLSAVIVPMASGALTGLFAYLQVKKD